jgi:hypothetical protein
MLRQEIIVQLGLLHPKPPYASLISLLEKRTLGLLTRAIYCKPVLKWSFFHDGFLVAPAEWPFDAQEVFSLDDPPTPWEVQAHLGETGSGFRHDKVPICESSVLRWFLIGMPLPALATAMKVDIPVVLGHLRRALAAMLQSPRFLVWSLGTDLTPALVSGMVKPNKGSKNGTAIRHEDLIFHPYIKAQLAGGIRLNPVERDRSKYPLAFKSMEEKALFLVDHPNRERWLKARRGLWRCKKPEWAKMELA